MLHFLSPLALIALAPLAAIPAFTAFTGGRIPTSPPVEMAAVWLGHFDRQGPASWFGSLALSYAIAAVLAVIQYGAARALFGRRWVRSR